MSWFDRWETAKRGINENDDAVEKTWVAILALLGEVEDWLRARVIARSRGLRLSNLSAVRRFRIGVRDDARRVARRLRRALSGPRLVLSADDHLGVPEAPRDEEHTPRGAVAEALSDATHATDKVLEELGFTGKGFSNRSAADVIDLLEDAMINILRNVGSDLDRVTETIVRLSGRFSTRSSVEDYILGGPQGRKWQMNRNTMRLSTTSHIRAAWRRRVVTEASVAGTDRFRLDVPTSKVGEVAATGVIAQNLWKVKTLAEWQEIIGALNRERTHGSTFDTLGFVFGDYTYPVPVLVEEIQDATRQGAAWRAKAFKRSVA